VPSPGGNSSIKHLEATIGTPGGGTREFTADVRFSQPPADGEPAEDARRRADRRLKREKDALRKLAFEADPVAKAANDASRASAERERRAIAFEADPVAKAAYDASRASAERERRANEKQCLADVEQYAREGAVAPLVVIARDGTQKERWNALFRLYTLARAGDYASELVDEGVITLFTSLLPSAEVIPCEELPVLRHAARHLREDAASVLGYLAGANENDTNAAAVARAGAIPVLMSIMADGDPPCFSAACRSCDPPCFSAERVAVPAHWPQLKPVRDQSSSSQYSKDDLPSRLSAARTISVLADYRAGAEAIVCEEGAVQVLLRLLVAPSRFTPTACRPVGYKPKSGRPTGEDDANFDRRFFCRLHAGTTRGTRPGREVGARGRNRPFDLALVRVLHPRCPEVACGRSRPFHLIAGGVAGGGLRSRGALGSRA